VGAARLLSGRIAPTWSAELMATAAEQTFVAAVRAAEGVRQVAKASAFTTNAVNGAIPAANLAAYVAALQAAENTFLTSINSAANTLAAAGFTIPNAGTPNPGHAVPPPVKFVPDMATLGNRTATQ